MNEIGCFGACCFIVGFGWAMLLNRILRGRSGGRHRAATAPPLDRRGTPAAGPIPAPPAAAIAAVCYGGPLDGYRFTCRADASGHVFRYATDSDPPWRERRAVYRWADRSDCGGRRVYAFDKALKLTDTPNA